MLKIKIFLILFLFASLGWSQERCFNLFFQIEVSADAFSFLRQTKLPTGRLSLAVQDDYDTLIKAGGGGSCATVTAGNLIQTLRVMAGETNLLDLSKVIKKAYKDMPSLRNGRVTNSEMNQLLNYFQNYSATSSFSVKIDFLQVNHEGEEKARNWKAHAQIDESLLVVHPKELKIVAYTVTDVEGYLWGRHFVILSSSQGAKITVVDPTSPLKDYKYDLKPIALDGENSSLRLLRPGSAGSGAFTNVIDTIFTVKIK